MTVDEYIAQFDGDTRQRLIKLRDLVKGGAPGSYEGIMYGLVGYKYHNKPLVYFGGFAHHIGFYATPNGHEAFAGAFSKYKQGKGSVQFPLNEPLPVDLIKQVIAFRRRQLEVGNHVTKNNT